MVCFTSGLDYPFLHVLIDQSQQVFSTLLEERPSYQLWLFSSCMLHMSHRRETYRTDLVASSPIETRGRQAY